MRTPILLDTCALLWLANKSPMKAEAQAALREMDDQPGGVLVSPISAWEIGQLFSRGRLALMAEPLAWFNRALDAGLSLADMPPEVLVASSYLPGGLLRDPADRIIAATTRIFGYRLMTRDAPLLTFGDQGYLQAIAC